MIVFILLGIAVFWLGMGYLVSKILDLAFDD